MKKMLFVFTIICLFALTATAQDIDKTIKVTPGEELDVDLDVGGDIEVKGWDKDEVQVKGRTRYRDDDDYEIKIEKRGKKVLVEVFDNRRSRDRWGRHNDRNGIRFEIMVPKKFDVTAETMGGYIVISDVEGEFRGKTMGGDIELTNLKGYTSLTTMGGEITVKKSELDGSVSTMGGEVLIEDVVGDLKASSMGGQVIHRNVTDGRGRTSGKEVRIKTMGGPIRVNDAPEGATLNTMGGDIRVRSVGKFVFAETMGGNIDLGKVDGTVEAITYGGDIYVEIISDPNSENKDIELSSLSGDIEVILPPDFSMDVDIEIEYTRRSRGKYKIDSDFEFEIEESKEWERSSRIRSGDSSRYGRSRGQESKFITGKGKLKGGKNRLLISTINGNVILKKGK